MVRTWRPMVPIRSMSVPVMTPAAGMSWSWAAARAVVKPGRSGSVPGTLSVASVIAVRRTW
ncbi:hypothetical protein SAMN05444920_109284 [Nonomuraea solani]|uniref:Uncharacterized protein n=1 Tax=Nonomuraea solani TaxID=1144553 RepID=A0A1H6EGP3_9ACTN|nr:hypothetical protein [Nonomuraea solani]SEG96109.1 hypothetical protein SAMN05444920_109284 [Nonomuraea solani]